MLTRIEEAGLTIKLKKCHFGAQECTYLGYRVGHGGVQPEEEKVKAVLEMPRPHSKKDVKSFLRLTGYYRHFIRDYATIATPLTHLTRKGESEKIC